jgi:hypothetical protein
MTLPEFGHGPEFLTPSRHEKSIPDAVLGPHKTFGTAVANSPIRIE